MRLIRPTAAQRGYDAPWRRYRERFLAEHPFCRLCEQLGRVTPATVVDHIEPHRGNQRLFWDPENHQALCQTCHDGPKKEFERSGTLRGCDADGLPLDPNHPWRDGGE